MKIPGSRSSLVIVDTAAQTRRFSPRVTAVRTVRSLVLAAVATVMGAAGATPAKVRSVTQVSKPAAAPSGNAENGKRLYMKYGCSECHSLEGQGSPASGPRIGPDPVPLSTLIWYVRQPTGNMPPYTEKVVSDQELADIHAFLESLPHPPAAKTIPLLR